jgi:hypothetical protein
MSCILSLHANVEYTIIGCVTRVSLARKEAGWSCGAVFVASGRGLSVTTVCGCVDFVSCLRYGQRLRVYCSEEGGDLCIVLECPVSAVLLI